MEFFEDYLLITYLNPEAIKLWEYTLRKYSDLIFSSSLREDQFKRATNLFERVCFTKNIEPYNLKLLNIASKLRRL